HPTVLFHQQVLEVSSHQYSFGYKFSINSSGETLTCRSILRNVPIASSWRSGTTQPISSSLEFRFFKIT
ncbi:MAG TPA: hypothetical protein VIX20_11065, partial [Ktedonobacteraceae bacterium]